MDMLVWRDGTDVISGCVAGSQEQKVISDC